jgi:hypothetical protein
MTEDPETEINKIVDEQQRRYLNQRITHDSMFAGFCPLSSAI